MAVTVTDVRTTPTNGEADATTGWTGSATLTLFTTDPDPVEATGSLGMVVSTATQNLYLTISSTNLQNTLAYIWVFPRGAMDTTANGGQTLVLGDGTNLVGYHLAGSDKAAFRHENGPVGWQCLMLDTGNLPSAATAYAGTVGGLNLAAVTRIGAGYKTLAKSVGGVSNCFTDVVRYGNGGLRITAGTSGAPGKFSEIAADDRTTTTGKGYGIIRELGTGLYGVQGPLTFGDTAGTTASYFADTSTSVVFEDRGVVGGRYSITVQGNATGSTTFQLGTPSGTGDAKTGINGCTITMPAATSGTFVATDADLQFCLIYGSTLNGFRGGLTFSSNATNGPNHDFCGNTLVNCGQMTPGRIVVRNCTFTAFVGASTGAEAAILWDANTNLKRSSFNCATTTTNSIKGHGIKISNTGTVNFDTITFTGYGPDVFGFNTTTAVDAATDVVTQAGHGYTTGDGIRYMKQGGTANIGLTDNTTYYVRAVSSSTIAFYTSSANAVADTSRIALTSTGSETHYINSMDAAVFNDSGGSVTINVTTGTTPTIRNGSGASTTVVSSVSITLTGLQDNTEVRVYDAGTDAAIAGTEVATDGTSGNRSFSFSDSPGNIVYIVIHALAYKYLRINNFTIPSSSSSIPIQQEIDRNYSNT
jgi:hypothetical protein